MGKVKKNKGGGGTKKKGKMANRGFKRGGGGFDKGKFGGGGGFDRSGKFGGGGRGFDRSAKFGGGGRAPVQEEKVKVDNPFEIRMHRAKHDNLGRRARHEKGLPGVSRGKAVEKRRETLLKEYKVRNKSSLLVDKRIGEKIKNMSEEEKIIKRSVMEKRRQYKQKSIFNLPSTDDILTHKGQALLDIDRYEDPRDESDSDDERLNEEFVSDAHFSGGFLKVKSKSEAEEMEDEDAGKSRKDIIAELILNSKQRKMEKAKEADENYELVTKLDQEFKTPDFRNLLNFVRKDGTESKDAAPRKEDYDKIVRELQFETKTGLASNRLKTEDEVEEDELKKLKKLERDRKRRMLSQDPTIPQHKSADELNDDYEVDEDIPTLTYKLDGKLNTNDSEEDEDDQSDDEDEAAEDEESEDSENSDAFSDLDSDDDEDDAAHKKTKDLSMQSDGNEVGNEDQDSTAKNDDIPYTLALPKSYDAFKKLMSKYHALVKDDEKVIDRFRVVSERLVKYSLLADKNRSPELFLYLLQFVLEGVDSAKSFSDNLQSIVSIATINLHTVLLTNPAKCVELMENGIVQMHSPDKSCKLRLSNIVLFEICSKLFCVTDFCHRVLSPMKVKILDAIHSCNVGSYMELLKVLRLVDVIYELSHESKRYCPEAMKILLEILEAFCLPMEKLRMRRRRFEFLKLANFQSATEDWDSYNTAPDITESDDASPSPDQVMCVLLRVFDLISKFIECQHKTKAFSGLIYKVLMTERLVLKLKWENKSFHKTLFSKRLPTSLIVPQGGTVEDSAPSISVDRPKMIKLYEPMIEENFDNRRKKMKRKGQTQEEARLSHKVKKEMKSAVREIIKDNAFLAKQQMKEQAMKDAERSRKVKELLGSLSNQEGDYRRLKRQKE